VCGPDTDECLDEGVCGEGLCVNVDGGFECDCADGYVAGVDGTCEGTSYTLLHVLHVLHVLSATRLRLAILYMSRHFRVEYAMELSKDNFGVLSSNLPCSLSIFCVSLSKYQKLECGSMPNVMVALPSVQRRKVWLTPTTRCRAVTLPRRETR